MAHTRSQHIAIAAGLGCASTLLAPQTAQALPLALDSLPLDGLSALADSPVAPFAVGALVGTAVTSVVAAVELRGMQRRLGAEREAEKDQAAPQMPQDASATAVFEAPRAGFTSRIMTKITSATRRDPSEGVPVIARASNAPSEAEAWAEIDAFMEETPFSCDPSQSHDIYQIALAELASQRTGAVDTRAAAPAGAPSAPAASAAPRPRTIEEERQADADAALATLDKLVDMDEPPQPAASAPVKLSSGARRPVAAQVAPLSTSQPASQTAAPAGTVAVADYSGHEAMWAEALAVFDEPAAPVAPAGEKRAPASPIGPLPAQRTAASAASSAASVDSTGAFLAAAKLAGYQPVASAAAHPVFSGQPVVLVPAYAVPVSSLGSQRSAQQDAFVDAAPTARARIDEIFDEESALIGKLKRSGVYKGVLHRHLSVVDGRTEAMPRLTAQQG